MAVFMRHITYLASKARNFFKQSKVTDYEQEGKCSSGEINILSESGYSAIGIVREKSVTVNCRERMDFIVLKVFTFVC